MRAFDRMSIFFCLLLCLINGVKVGEKFNFNKIWEILFLLDFDGSSPNDSVKNAKIFLRFREKKGAK